MPEVKKWEYVLESGEDHCVVEEGRDFDPDARILFMEASQDEQDEIIAATFQNIVRYRNAHPVLVDALEAALNFLPEQSTHPSTMFLRDKLLSALSIAGEGE